MRCPLLLPLPPVCIHGQDSKARQRVRKVGLRREAMVLWLRRMALDQEVVGWNPNTLYWMYVSVASCNIIEKKQK